MAKPIFIGQMDRVIQIKKKVITQTSTNAEVTAEELVCSPWAYMEDLSGNEDVEGKVRHLINRTYTIRYNAEVKSRGTALTLFDEERKFEIIHIVEIGRKQHLEIRVKSYE
jgi:head-tail adaptor